MQVSSQPYLKSYNFSLFSVAALTKIIFIAITIALPFFATYSTGNFYLSSNLAVNTTQNITHNSKYFIEIVTISSTYIYTNLYSQPFINAITIEKSQEGSVIDYSIRWSKINSNEHVKRVEITLFYDYVMRGVACFGMSTGKIEGYSIGEGTIGGLLSIVQGTGSKPYTQNSFILNGYSLPNTYQQMMQSSSYLTYKHSSLPINLPSDMLQVRMIVNKGLYLATNETPSILGQLIWSFMQYFPIFLSLYWILDAIFCFLLREKIVRSDLAHDKEYLSLIEQQNQRRERLRLR